MERIFINYNKKFYVFNHFDESICRGYYNTGMEKLMNNLKAAMALHLKGMIEDGEELSVATSEAEYILV